VSAASFTMTPAGKVKWQPKRATLPDTLICSQTEAIALLREQVFRDAIAARVLKPCVHKRCTKETTKLYAVKAVQAVAERIVGGQYPDVRNGGWLEASNQVEPRL
jgi:hypothetical protein